MDFVDTPEVLLQSRPDFFGQHCTPVLIAFARSINRMLVPNIRTAINRCSPFSLLSTAVTSARVSTTGNRFDFRARFVAKARVGVRKHTDRGGRAGITSRNLLERTPGIVLDSTWLLVSAAKQPKETVAKGLPDFTPDKGYQMPCHCI